MNGAVRDLKDAKKIKFTGLGNLLKKDIERQRKSQE